MDIGTVLIVVGLVVVALALRFARTTIYVRDGLKYYVRALSWRDRLSLLVNGNIYVGLRSREDWEGGSLPHFIFRCKAHGYVVDHPHGYYDEIRCPECAKKHPGVNDDVMSPL